MNNIDFNKRITPEAWSDHNLDFTKKGIVKHNDNIAKVVEVLWPDFRFSTFDRKVYFNNTKLTEVNLFQMAQKLSVLFGRQFRKNEVEEAVRTLASQTEFSQLKDYFTELPKVPTNAKRYLDSWLIDICGASDTPINRVIGRKWLVSGVGRALNPGSYAEGTLMLYGKTSAGKTELFSLINPNIDWFSNSPIDMENSQKASQLMMGKFVIEFGEMRDIKKKDIETVKNFLTTLSDDYIPKYSNENMKVPRSCIFGGSTNSPDIINDSTGGRRFWCVKVSDKINNELLVSIRDQLWAEALEAYNAEDRYTWVLTKEERDQLDKSNVIFTEDDAFAEWLGDRLDQADMKERTFFTAAELKKICDNYDSRGVYSKKISAALLHTLKWTRGYNTKGCARYFRPNDTLSKATQTEYRLNYEQDKNGVMEVLERGTDVWTRSN